MYIYMYLFIYLHIYIYIYIYICKYIKYLLYNYRVSQRFFLDWSVYVIVILLINV